MDATETLSANQTIELVTFRVGDLLIGADIRQVEEINRDVDATPLPHAPDHVSGVLNLRGDVVTVVDLGKILELPSDPLSGRSHNVVVRCEGERVGLLVDRIEDVVHAPVCEIDELPANFNTIDGRFLEGVYVMDEELLLVLNINETLAVQ